MANSGGTTRAKGEEHNLIVALRTRPLNDEELFQGATPIAHCVDNKMVVLLDPQEDPDDILRANRTREKQFIFDLCFDGTGSQEEVYTKTSQPLIQTVVNGFNATVFAYGATGAGKTYTMLGTDNEPGIMARSLNDLFKEITQSSDEFTYKVSMSYLEIYNEMIRDLLNPDTGFLDLREDSKGIQIPGLQEIKAKSTTHVMDMLVEGNKERTQEPTAANKTSSRSHAILQVTVRQRPRIHGPTHEVRTGKLFLIDLAGSERAAATHNRGKRMVEGAHINRSLLALGNCINALSDKNGAKYVNFRDSKLTRLLKDALGGNCKTVMIAHVSPASIHFEETRNTLLYAERAKHIKTKVRKNVMDVTYHIHQYTNIISELRVEVKRLRVKLDQQAMAHNNASAIQAIQTEVLEISEREDERGLNCLKDKLTDIFREQMELRRSIMELDNTALEVRLEAARNQLLIQKWEKERALAKQHQSDKEEESGTESQDPQIKDENPKDDTKEKSSSNRTLEKGQEETEVGEPEEVRIAREELVSLQEEKERTDLLRASIQKELDNAREKATKIEQMLPQKINNAEQQEILNLLVKVHELEIENMEMQSACLLRNFEIRRKDMVIAKYRQHLNLCDEIIHQQRDLLEDHEVMTPKDLDELYELYKHELRDRPDSAATLPEPLNPNKIGSLTSLQRRLESDSMSDMDRLTAVDEEVNNLPQSSRVLAPLIKKPNPRRNEDDKIFSLSSKAREIDAEGRVGAVSSMTSITGGVPQPQDRQRSIITLSSHSTSGSPPPPLDSNKLPSNGLQKKKPENREEIVSKTRNIAALAAARRTKAQLDAYNNERLASFTSLQGRDKRHDDSMLTMSRLALHDKKYGGSTLTLNTVVDDRMSTGTADDVATLRNAPGRSRNRVTTQRNQPAVRTNHKKRARSQDPVSYQALSRTMPSRKAAEQKAATHPIGRRTRIPQGHTIASRARAAGAHTNNDNSSNLREFESSNTPPTAVFQSNTERGNGLMLQKRVRGPNNDSLKGQNTRTNRQTPTIPAGYRKTDIAISGFGLQK